MVMVCGEAGLREVHTSEEVRTVVTPTRPKRRVKARVREMKRNNH